MGVSGAKKSFNLIKSRPLHETQQISKTTDYQ